MNKADIGPKTMDAIKRLNATTIKPDRHGWIEYPPGLNARGNFVERLPVIMSLIGSAEYEYKIVNKVYIRRVQD